MVIEPGLYKSLKDRALSIEKFGGELIYTEV